MNFLQVILVVFLGTTVFSTVITVFWEGGVVVQPMSVQAIWQREFLPTLFTRKALKQI